MTATRTRVLQTAAVTVALVALVLAFAGLAWTTPLVLVAIGLTVWAHGHPGYSDRLSTGMVVVSLAAMVVLAITTWPPPYLS